MATHHFALDLKQPNPISALDYQKLIDDFLQEANSKNMVLSSSDKTRLLATYIRIRAHLFYPNTVHGAHTPAPYAPHEPLIPSDEDKQAYNTSVAAIYHKNLAALMKASWHFYEAPAPKKTALRKAPKKTPNPIQVLSQNNIRSLIHFLKTDLKEHMDPKTATTTTTPTGTSTTTKAASSAPNTSATAVPQSIQIGLKSKTPLEATAPTLDDEASDAPKPGQSIKKRSVSTWEVVTRVLTQGIRNAKARLAYSKIYGGKKYQKAGVSPFTINAMRSSLSTPTPSSATASVASSSSAAAAAKTKPTTPANATLRTLAPEEIPLFSALINLELKLQHATNHYYPIANSGTLDSLTEIRRPKETTFDSAFSTKGNIEALGNDGFVFFRVYCPGTNGQESRYGGSRLHFEDQILNRNGWISLHDQLIPLSGTNHRSYIPNTKTGSLSQLIRMVSVDKDGRKNLSPMLNYLYRKKPLTLSIAKKDAQNAFTKFAKDSPLMPTLVKRSMTEEIFYGPQIRLGLALSVIRELRYLRECGYHKHVLDTFKTLSASNNTAERDLFLGNLIKRFFRTEGKMPVNVNLQDTPPIWVETPYGDLRYRSDLHPNVLLTKLGTMNDRLVPLAQELSTANKLHARAKASDNPDFKCRTKVYANDIARLKLEQETIKAFVKQQNLLATQTLVLINAAYKMISPKNRNLSELPLNEVFAILFYKLPYDLRAHLEEIQSTQIPELEALNMLLLFLDALQENPYRQCIMEGTLTLSQLNTSAMTLFHKKNTGTSTKTSAKMTPLFKSPPIVLKKPATPDPMTIDDLKLAFEKSLYLPTDDISTTDEEDEEEYSSSNEDVEGSSSADEYDSEGISDESEFDEEDENVESDNDDPFSSSNEDATSQYSSAKSSSSGYFPSTTGSLSQASEDESLGSVNDDINDDSLLDASAKHVPTKMPATKSCGLRSGSRR